MASRCIAHSLPLGLKRCGALAALLAPCSFAGQDAATGRGCVLNSRIMTSCCASCFRSVGLEAPGRTTYLGPFLRLPSPWSHGGFRAQEATAGGRLDTVSAEDVSPSGVGTCSWHVEPTTSPLRPRACAASTAGSTGLLCSLPESTAGLVISACLLRSPRPPGGKCIQDTWVDNAAALGDKKPTAEEWLLRKFRE